MSDFYQDYSEVYSVIVGNGDVRESGNNYLYIRTPYYISEDSIGTLAKSTTSIDNTSKYNQCEISGDNYIDTADYISYSYSSCCL